MIKTDAKKTGVFDKNGQEIQEGSFVKLTNFNPDADNTDEIRTVKYRNGKFFLEELDSFHPVFCSLDMANPELTEIVGGADDAGNTADASANFGLDTKEYKGHSNRSSSSSASDANFGIGRDEYGKEPDPRRYDLFSGR